MMNIEIQIPSSSSDAIYLVSVVKDEQGVLMGCTCPAGTFGKLCKHKLEVLNACSNATDSHFSSAYHDIRQMIDSTDIPFRLSDMSRADQDFQKAKLNLESAKKNLEKLLAGRSVRK